MAVGCSGTYAMFYTIISGAILPFLETAVYLVDSIDIGVLIWDAYLISG